MRSHNLSADDTGYGGGLLQGLRGFAPTEDVILPQPAVSNDLKARLDFGFKDTPS